LDIDALHPQPRPRASCRHGDRVTGRASLARSRSICYLGLAFASLIGFVAAVGAAHYFAQGSSGTASDHVYYSFTVLATTGFRDLTAAHSLGHVLAVIEMLIGQLYWSPSSAS
jgi:Ion channel